MVRSPGTAFRRRVLALVFLCVLIMPQMIPPATSAAADYHYLAQYEGNRAAGHHHPGAAWGDLSEKCQSGINCHVQDIVEIPQIPTRRCALDGKQSPPGGLIEPGIELGLDPPPPRATT